MTARANLQAVKDTLDQAAEPGISDFGDDFEGAGRRGRDDGSAPPAMPPGCPVIPLGTEGGIFYFLSALGELRALKAKDIGNKDIVGMFAPLVSYLYDAWPARKEVAMRDGGGRLLKDANGDTVTEWVTTGWRTAEVTELLMNVGADRGVWSAREKVRGRGAWSDEQGRLILHCGNMVLHGGRWARPGMIDGFVYPTAPPIPRPAPKKAGTEAAKWLLGLL